MDAGLEMAVAKWRGLRSALADAGQAVGRVHVGTWQGRAAERFAAELMDGAEAYGRAVEAADRAVIALERHAQAVME